MASPTPLTRGLRDIAAYVSRGWHDRAFETLAQVHPERPRPRLTKLLNTLLPLAREPRGISHGADRVAARHSEQDGWLERATRATDGTDDFEQVDSNLLDVIDAMLRKAHASEPELWEAVYADPADDEARLVLADLLTQRSDPRGELIVLQIQRAQRGGKDRATPRENELLRQFATIWLGSLRHDVTDVVYRRGFVAEGRYIGGRYNFDDPAWRTLEVLDTQYRVGLRELLHPNLRNLRQSCGLSGDLLQQAAEKSIQLALEHAGIWLPFEPFYDQALVRKVVPKLRRVDLFYRSDESRIVPLFAAGHRQVGFSRGRDFLKRGCSIVQSAPVGSKLILGLRDVWRAEDDWQQWTLSLCNAPELQLEASLQGAGDGLDLVPSLRRSGVKQIILSRRGRPRAKPEQRAALLAELKALHIDPILQSSW